MGWIIPVLGVGFRKKKQNPIVQANINYSHSHTFLYQKPLSLHGNNALSEDIAYDNVFREKRKMHSFIPLPSNTYGSKKCTLVDRMERYTDKAKADLLELQCCG